VLRRLGGHDPDVTLPDSLKAFVAAQKWTFAKTYASTWPHEYIVCDRVNEYLFGQLVRHIRKHGYEGNFYAKPITYFEENGMVYWTMGSPIEKTSIVNRCKEEQTYEYRLMHGKLPEQLRADLCLFVITQQNGDRIQPHC
jgi:hypothetical protein